MNKKSKVVLKVSIAIVGALLFTTPNQIFKDSFSVNKVEINENNAVQRYLDKNENFKGVGIIKNNYDDNKIKKNEDAYIVLKNPSGKYYNNVNLKEQKDGIIISYNESSINNEYENNLYNTRVDEVMVLRIKANDTIKNIEIVNN